MMQTFEIEVDMRVRKTLRVAGPATSALAREVVQSMLTPDGIWPSLAHYEPEFGIPRPVERMIDNSPEIVSVKLIPQAQP